MKIFISGPVKYGGYRMGKIGFVKRAISIPQLIQKFKYSREK